MHSSPEKTFSPVIITTIKEEIETPVIQKIKLDTLAAHFNDGIKVELLIKQVPGKNGFYYEFRKAGLGDNSILHKCNSLSYIGEYKGNKLEEIIKTGLHSALYTNKIIYNKYQNQENGVSKTIYEIINHPEIILKYNDWLKKYEYNSDLSDPYTPEGDELIKDSKTSFYLSNPELQIYENTRNKNKDGSSYNISKILIDAYPIESKIIQSPLLDRRIKYKIKWSSKEIGYPIETEGTIKNIIHELEVNGLIFNSYNIVDKMAFVLSEMRKKGYLIKEYGIQEPGFFWFDNKIISVGYNCKELPELEDLKKSLNILEDFGSHFKTEKGDIRDKLATIFKLTLISPFDYVKKELGYDRGVPFLYGAPGTAKTSLMQLPRFVYDIPKDYYIQSGGSASTEARLSGLMLESTFPRLVDEAETIFRKPELISLNKQAMNEKFSRKIRDKHQNEILQPAYCTLLYTSNESPFKHSKDGSVRRYNIIGFDETHKPTEDEKEDFKDKWKASDKGQYQDNTPLNYLKYIGQFVANTLINNPTLLKQNTRSLTDNLIKDMYSHAGMEAPLWLLGWTQVENETIYRELENSQILNLMKQRINDAYSTRIIVSDPETGFNDNQAKIETEIEHKNEKLQKVAESDHIPWLTFSMLKKADHYIIDNGVLNEITQKTGLNLSLTELANRFSEFEYKSIKRNGTTIRVIVSNKSCFEKLIYPKWSEPQTDIKEVMKEWSDF